MALDDSRALAGRERYDLVGEKIAEGGMGMVYKGRHRESNSSPSKSFHRK